MNKEDLKFLKELGKKMNAQDNRATQFPMFVVKQKVKQYLNEDYCSECERREEYNGSLCDKCQKLVDNDEELPERCDDCPSDVFDWFEWKDKIVEDCGAFFTAEEAQEHINMNSYHYTEPFVYGIPSWRNYEMQKVLNILSKLGGDGESNNWYK